MSYASTRRCRSSVRSSAAVAAVLFAAATGSAATAAETYTVKMDRPVTVGQEFTVTVTADVTRKLKIKPKGKAQQEKEDTYKAELTGTEKVEAVNDKTGAATKVTVTVEKLTKNGAELYPAGTVITADHTGGKKAFTVDGAEVDPEKVGVLATLIDVTSSDRTVSQDQAMGTDAKQAVGASWDGDTAKVVEMLNGEDVPVAAEHVKASSKLVEVRTVDGMPSQVVESTIKVDELDAGKEVHGMTVAGGSVDATVTETFPTDATLQPTVVDDHAKISVKATGGGGAVSIDVRTDEKIHRTMTPKK